VIDGALTIDERRNRAGLACLTCKKLTDKRRHGHAVGIGSVSFSLSCQSVFILALHVPVEILATFSPSAYGIIHALICLFDLHLFLLESIVL
jgi:hypothetical protein